MLSAETRRSVRRSRKRDDALLAFLARGRMTLHELAFAIGVEPERAMGVLVGGSDAYATELGLVTLGLVARVISSLGVEFELTTAGKRGALAVARARVAGRRL